MLRRSWLLEKTETFVHPWKGLRIHHFYRVALTVGHTVSQRTLFPRREDASTVTFCIIRLDDFFLQHLLYLLRSRQSRC